VPGTQAFRAQAAEAERLRAEASEARARLQTKEAILEEREARLHRLRADNAQLAELAQAKEVHCCHANGLLGSPQETSCTAGPLRPSLLAGYLP
jgi:chromosome segregation ATPase